MKGCAVETVSGIPTKRLLAGEEQLKTLDLKNRDLGFFEVCVLSSFLEHSAASHVTDLDLRENLPLGVSAARRLVRLLKETPGESLSLRRVSRIPVGVLVHGHEPGGAAAPGAQSGAGPSDLCPEIPPELLQGA